MHDNQDILRALKDNLQMAQNQQNIFVDKHIIDRVFQVGDLVYLRLQPYRQYSLKKNKAMKLQPRFYGPYKISRRIGEVAYELDLPASSRIHNVFHVSCLKKVVGQQVVVSEELPPLDDEGQLVLVPDFTPYTGERGEG